jgi:hypothetical protein
VFTIPVLPITIVYEPPADAARRNRASYRNARSLCTATEAAFASDVATTRPGDLGVPGFAGAREFKLALAAVGQLGDLLDQRVLRAIGRVSDLVDAAVGTAEAREVRGSSSVRSERLVSCLGGGETLSTLANDGGPGVGDQFSYWKNVRVLWLADRGRVRMLVVSREPVLTDALTLRTALRTNDGARLALFGLTPERARALLALDPFVAAPTREPDPGRFTAGSPITMGCGGTEMSLVHEVTSSETGARREATTRFRVRLEDYRAGFVSFLGIGVAESRSLEARFAHTAATEGTEGVETRATAELWCTPGAPPYVVYWYVDEVFRSFAFRAGEAASRPPIAGPPPTAPAAHSAGRWCASLRGAPPTRPTRTRKGASRSSRAWRRGP